MNDKIQCQIDKHEKQERDNDHVPVYLLCVCFPGSDETTYYWRVSSTNPLCGFGSWSISFDFTTILCQSFMSTDVPITIPLQGSPTITSDLPIPINEEIVDMNVISLTGTHTWVDDLRFTLISPALTEVIIWDRPCDGQDNFNINFDDEALDSNWPCPPTNGMTYKPSNIMNPYNGQMSSGNWVLKVKDLQNQDGGSLTGWGLRVCWDVCQLLVTQTSGTNTGSLPAAFSCAAPGDTIFLSADLAGQTINVGGAPMILNKNVTIIALAPNINITGTGTRPFEVPAGFTVEFNGMMITAGTSMTGGAILNQGILTLENVTIEKNASVSGATLVSNTGGTLRMEGSCSIHQ